MKDRIIRRYSQEFKRQVVEEVESGKFASMQLASACIMGSAVHEAVDLYNQYRPHNELKNRTPMSVHKAAFVPLGKSRGGEREVVGEEHKMLAGGGIGKSDPAQDRRIMFSRSCPAQFDGLIGAKPAAAIDRSGLDDAEIQIVSAQMRHDRCSLASARVERETLRRMPR